LIHTADWQVGKPFRRFGEREATLRVARLAAIEAVGKLALAHGAAHVLVAGDVYDSEAPSGRTLLEPLERMRGFASLTFHLIPGNHDPHRANGVWHRCKQTGLPANVMLHLEPEPYALGEEAVLLPAPLRRKAEVADLTEWMNSAATPAGKIRVGLAHGSVVDFGVEGEAHNPIAALRADRAGLSYLGLGDWHRTMRVNAQTWYAGTPEPDGFGSQVEGQALLVEVAGVGAEPQVKPLTVGTYRWLTEEIEIQSVTEFEAIEQRLRAGAALSSTILRLKLKGALSLSDRAAIEKRLSALEAAVFHLDVQDEGLLAAPSEADLEAIDFGGVLREAADRLKAMAADLAKPLEERRLAERALVKLYFIALGQGPEAAAPR
jgi:DNA repair exonuclease SbcCD nuclease subunit